MSVEKQFGKGKIILQKGDITEMTVDAIVNAANSHLQHGGGVAGAIVLKGGWIIQEESNRIGFTPVGKAAITSAGNLKARFVIHAVGPRMGEGDEDTKLENATGSSLDIFKKNNLHSVAFPAISTGIFGYPVERCAPIMLGICKTFLEQETESREIYFCLFSDSDYRQFEKTLSTL